MINKNKFSIKDTKKVLHKVGKRWVVVSAVLLGLAAGGAAVTTANADTTNAQAAQPTAAQQVNKNANMSAANHSLGAADPANATKAPATMKLGAAQGDNDSINVNTLMSSAINDVKGKVPAVKASVKNRAKGYASAYSQYADVNHLTELANDVKGNASASAAYTNLVNLANNVNGSAYSSVALGTTNDKATNTIFGMMSEASSAINTIYNSGSVDAKGKMFLSKASSIINKVSGYANNTSLGANRSIPISAGKFGVEFSSGASISLSSAISVPNTTIKISNVVLPSNFTFKPGFKLSLPTINMPQLINNGLNSSSASAVVNSAVSQVVSDASNSITTNAENAAQNFLEQNAGTIAQSVANSIASSNDVSTKANSFVTDYNKANNYATDYRNNKNLLTQVATGYQDAYIQLNPIANPVYQNAAEATLASKNAKVQGFKNKALKNLNTVKSKIIQELTANKLLQQPQAKDFETTLQNTSDTSAVSQAVNTAIPEVIKNRTGFTSVQSLISNKTGLSSNDANTLLNNLNDSTNSVSDALNGVFSTKLNNLPVPKAVANKLVNDLENPSNQSNVNATVANDLEPTIEGYIKSENIKSTVGNKVNTQLRNMAYEVNNDIDDAISFVFNSAFVFKSGGNNVIAPLSQFTLSKLQTYLSGVAGNGSLISKNKQFADLSNVGKELSNVASKYSGYLNNNINKYLTAFFASKSTTSSAYNSLISAVAALPSDLTNTPNAKSGSTEEAKAYSAYSTIASGAQAILNAAKRHVSATPQYAHYVSDASNYATPSIVNEANASANSMSTETASFTSAVSNVNKVINSIESQSKNSASYTNYSNSLQQAKNDSLSISAESSAYANSLANSSVNNSNASQFANDADGIKLDVKKPASSGTKPASSGSKPASSGTKPASSGSKPASSGTKPASSGSKPASSGTKPASSGTKPASNNSNNSSANSSNAASAASAKASASASASVSASNSTKNSIASAAASSFASSKSAASSKAASESAANANNNNMPFIPSVPSFNNGSMANTNASASDESNSMSANANNSSAEPKARVANYVTVEKELQLHTSPNFTKKNRVMTVEPGTRLDLEKTVRARHGLVRYEVNYKGKSYFVTANKKFTTHLSYELAKPSHYRYFKVGKALQLHTSPYFTKKNGVMTVKPGAEFRINRVVKAHGFVRYEVSYKGSVYFVTANKAFSANAYLQKSNFRKHGRKSVRVIKTVSEYKKANFKKHSLIRNFRRGSVLPVKRVITIANGEMTRLQLTNGRYVTSNKDFVRVIK